MTLLGLTQWAIQKVYDLYSDGWFNFIPYVWSKLKKLNDFTAARVVNHLETKLHPPVEIEVHHLDPITYDNLLTEQQRAPYRFLDFGNKPSRAIWGGIDIGYSDSPDRTGVSVVRTEEEGDDSSPSETQV